MQYPTRLPAGLAAIAVLLSLALPLNLFAQTRYTALLPDLEGAVPSDGTNNLRVAAEKDGKERVRSIVAYNLNNLPQHSQVNLLTLQLYVASIGSPDLFATQMVSALKGRTLKYLPTSLQDPSIDWSDIDKNELKQIGAAEVKKKTQSINLKLEIPDDPEKNYVNQFLPDGILTLAVRSPQKSQDNSFYSSPGAESSGNYPKKPKLIVNYEVGSYPFRNDWSQNFNSPQHTGYLNWQMSNDITAAKVRIIEEPDKDIFVGADPTGALLLYKNQPIVFTQAAAGTGSTFKVKQLDENGGKVWSVGVNDVAKSWPLIDAKGRLYYFTSNTMSIFNLDQSGRFELLSDGRIANGIPLSSITNNKVANINNNVTLGYDATIYLPFDKGIVALSAYPQLKIRWKYDNPGVEISGPVSLSRDESKVYFISVNKQQKTSRLVVLDNMEGTVIDSKALEGGYESGGNYFIPAPVVQNDSEIFVLNGFDNGNKLQVFKFNTTNNKLDVTDIIASTASNTGISQPAIDDVGNAFFVFDHKIARYNETANPKLYISESSYKLNNASILVVNASADIYALDPYNGNKLYAFKNYKERVQNSFYVDITGAGNMKKNLILSSTGTLYTVSGNVLVSITSKTVTNDNIIITSNNINTNTTYLANKSITCESFEVVSSVNTILYSGGTISFKEGFHVKTGAQLSCKTGY